MDGRKGKGRQGRAGGGAAGDAGRGSGARAGRGASGPELGKIALRSADGVHTVLVGGQPAKTPGGKIVATPSRRLAEQIRRETEISRELDAGVLSAFGLLATQLDHIETGDDPIAEDVGAFLAEREPLVGWAGGDDERDVESSWRAATELLAALGTALPDAAAAVGADAADDDEADEVALPESFVVALEGAYAALTPAERTAVNVLDQAHQAGLLLPLALVGGRCTPSEYAEGLLAAHGAHARHFEVPWRDHGHNFTVAREDATIVAEFVALSK